MSLSVEPPPGFEDLSVEEKIAYVQTLWDLITQRPDDIPVPDWHREIIAERLADARSTTSTGRPWAEVRASIQARLRIVRP